MFHFDSVFIIACSCLALGFIIGVLFGFEQGEKLGKLAAQEEALLNQIAGMLKNKEADDQEERQ